MSQKKDDKIKTAEAVDNEAFKEEIHKQSMKILKRLPAMGPVLLLYMQSSHRRYHFIADLEWLLMPPLIAGQCKLFMKKEYPTSFISWAFLNKEAEARLFANGGKLRPEDWNCGDRLWIIDIVAPFGGVENMLHDLQLNEFPGKVIRLAAPDPKTGGITARKLQPLKGKTASGEDESGGTVH
ncbi:ACP:hemolysin acyltransferase (hemolysin-activating protein) [Desulfocapsa sulfexigens DSM 10523]|uniref:RTX toxin-activating lysine-acyltransferase n=1 Tax=Desulfocapsa sulfexigens (strain DSM 10523 / SB164P1) TaxID=1167006 RepID=M1PKJ0_DESSD|nr:toxin-activating lysine-acyltransferase [Desulfocapsa sulfexigens]AGF76986.1 ACP:hemolysin acyltransferase (hemolysin-activating protein) [Desulfocapsa sulfexigens DSM 10523]